MVEEVITIVAILNVGSALSPVDKLMIFSIASRISCTEAKLITTERITMATGSNLVRPTTRDKLIMTDSITMAIGSNLVRPTTEIVLNNDRTSYY